MYKSGYMEDVKGEREKDYMAHLFQHVFFRALA